MGRTIIIGDVHGCFVELMELLEKAKFDQSEDKLIFLGDLINKGPDSVKVLKFVKEGGHSSIVGNHELGLLRAASNETYMVRGFLKLKEELGAEFDDYISWIKTFPLYIETDNFICIHGGLEPEVSIEKQRAEMATRIRTWDGTGDDLKDESNPPWYDFYKGEKIIVYGHWAAQGLIVRENTIGLDTGCVWGGDLSALILPDGEILSVSAKKMYKDPHS